MGFNLVTVRLWLDFSQTANFEVQYLLEGDTYQSRGRRLSEGGAYYDLKDNGVGVYKRAVFI